jgi:serpin B
MQKCPHGKWLCGVLLVGLVWSTGPVHGAPPPDRATVAQAVNAFGFGVMRQAGQGSENLLVSPYSIATALAMVRAGAQGRTLTQMDAGLGLGGIAGVDAGFGAIQGSLQSLKNGKGKGEGILRAANGLWAQEGYSFLPAFRQTAEGPYRGKVHSADFTKEPERARRAINGWVEEVTADKIMDLIPKDGVGANTRLVLANALYFKDTWDRPFEASHTHDDVFFVRGKTKDAVPTMSRRGRYLYAETEALQLLALPYTGRDSTMWIVLPKKRDGLGKVEGSLTAEGLWALERTATLTDVVVALPKFTFRSRMGLSGALKALGMTDAFGRDADFSKMTGGKDLKLAEAYHQTYLAVAEEGTEAAAATAATMELTTARQPEGPQPVTFIADHPFLLFIRHEATGVTLFQGRVTTPKP